MKRLLTAGRWEQVEAGTALTRQKHAGSDLYLLVDGTADVVVQKAGRTERRWTAGPGACIGPADLLDPGPSEATVIAAAPCAVIHLAHDQLSALTDSDPALAETLLDYLEMELRELKSEQMDLFTELAEVHPPTDDLDRGADNGAGSSIDSDPIEPGEAQRARSLLVDSDEFGSTVGPDLETLIRSLRIQTIGGGRTLVGADSHADAVWLVLDGELVTMYGEREVGRYLPGDWIATANVGSNSEAGLTVRALFPSTVARLSGSARRSMEESSAALRVQWRRALLRQLAREFRQVCSRVRGHLGSGERGADSSGNRTEHVDVVVVGAGPIGLAYAIWLKRARPETRIVVMDRRTRPGYKVGESALSTTVRSLRSLGLSQTMLRRLFANKLGLAFWWVGPDQPKPTTHIDVVEIEETFQVERRVLETALLQCATRMGIDVRAGRRVDVARSTVETPRSTLVCRAADGEYTMTTSIVCDASGIASVIPRSLGKRRKPRDTIDANTYFGYFKRVSHPDLDHWDIAATRHLCFPEGWWWFITVCSWDAMPDDALDDMVGAMLDELPIEDGDNVPTRAEFAKRFGGETEEIVSIGVVVRNDRDDSKHLNTQDRFDYWVKRYPGVEAVLRHYKRVENPYGKNHPILSFQNMVHDLESAAGDGWLAIGDSAFFVNPLFSPGLNFGSGTAYMAVQASIRALDTADTSRGSFETYENYRRAISTALFRENEMLYRSFRSARSFERVLMLKFFFGITDILPRGDYSPSDPYVYNLLDPHFSRTVQRVVDIMRDGEARGEHPDITAEAVAAVIDELVDRLRDLDVVRDARIGRYFTHYTDDLHRVDNRDRGRGDFRTWRCTGCRSFVDEMFRFCLVCGAERPVPTATAMTQN
ncbi:cyclic nucleotide-binding domain-containing protein [Nocardia sp. CS682]|uniref:cyclic nucleotide-binding domain-containing protein n=1 Tax=Nocardia sp. CS682 TaxID=1047172 RepID=UPI001431E38D|nr:cyclic nucleotide-binding domain-containing protein [Nocardia sp. CS682]